MLTSVKLARFSAERLHSVSCSAYHLICQLSYAATREEDLHDDGRYRLTQISLPPAESTRLGCVKHCPRQWLALLVEEGKKLKDDERNVGRDGRVRQKFLQRRVYTLLSHQPLLTLDVKPTLKAVSSSLIRW